MAAERHLSFEERNAVRRLVSERRRELAPDTDMDAVLTSRVERIAEKAAGQRGGLKTQERRRVVAEKVSGDSPKARLAEVRRQVREPRLRAEQQASTLGRDLETDGGLDPRIKLQLVVEKLEALVAERVELAVSAIMRRDGNAATQELRAAAEHLEGLAFHVPSEPETDMDAELQRRLERYSLKEAEPLEN